MKELDENVAKKVATLLLEVEAIKLRPNDPFHWSSGWLSPIYCDNRIALSYPKARDYIKECLCNLVKNRFPAAEAIAGVATAGIAQGVLIADTLSLPFAYVRPEPKKHGMGNQIEGRLKARQKVVLVEDLISTGGSSLKAADALMQADVEVIGMVAIFSYGLRVSEENFTEKNIELAVLSDYDHLVEVALSNNYITDQQLATLIDWRQSPEVWGK